MNYKKKKKGKKYKAGGEAVHKNEEIAAAP